MAADGVAPSASEAASKAFGEARATLRDTAKWVLSGFGALLVVVVGGTTISQFGALDPDDWRFWLAVTFGAIGLVLCVFPLRFALAVLTPETVTLKSMARARRGVRRRAFKRVEKTLTGQLTEGSVRAFLDSRERLTELAEKGTLAEKAAANDALDQMTDQYGQVAQVCLTTLVRTQFDELIIALSVSGAFILPAFLIFAWAANPGRDSEKTLPKPLIHAFKSDAQGAAVLKAAGLAQACYSPTTRVILLSEKPGGRMTGLAVTPGLGGPCPPTRVLLVDGQIRGVD